MKSACRPCCLSCLLAASRRRFAADGAAKAGAAAPAKPDLAKGEATATNVCMACHAMRRLARQPGQPDPAGPAPEYLVKQLTEFKAGQRKNPIMTRHRARR